MAPNKTREERESAWNAEGDRIGAPYEYNGVPVPVELRPNWDEVECHWWRRGVDAGGNELHGKILDRIADVYDEAANRFMKDPHMALQDIEAWICEEH